ncbi:MAG: 50S ribosomal protein L13 [Candidatus Magasanikbacteria bacterium CG11_big_fil_rev_8_21_14_0_20_39_34]|uniref:Large ribosomal subunit protein uL13 n=1 Tax=Candidatus Magasanikbacteria bacterium CG11_big_fil_rev_8_21_14_0_20_39_34 TaxID=1974653 RepID=A0A2H0N5D2_9BACT|nr:MAG: 50S ribosomal protein L13 [Candidatus Magasanikbacteria bacterium CG11_big_fil_rev_8_21_14_0_20_39_34]
MTNRTKHTIDATDQAVGRVATQAAVLLRGKNKATFVPYLDEGDTVEIVNASKVKFTGNKLVQKDYFHHTQHPGGLKQISMKKVFEKDPAEVMKKAVMGMLPKNKLRSHMMKRLIVKA